MPVFPCEFFRLFFSATLFDDIAAETNRYIREKINKAIPLKKTFDLGWVGRRHSRRADGVSWCYIAYGKTHEKFRQGLFL
jgi:hypothetical protein